VDGEPVDGLLYPVDAADGRHLRGVLDGLHRAVLQVHLVDDARRGRDEVEVVLALEPLLDDLHVQQSQEAAAEPEAEGLEVSGSNENARRSCAAFREGVPQVLVLRRQSVGKMPAKTIGLHVLEARERLGRSGAPRSVTVSPIFVS
jgi:hypothetical protein